eukprot:267006_1
MSCATSGKSCCKSTPEEKKTSIGDLETKVCYKCKNAPAITRYPLNPVCRTCFTTCFLRKFKTSVRRHTEIKHKDQLLLAFSGGQGSRATLDLLHRCVSKEAAKRMFFDTVVVHVDESALQKSDDSSLKAEEILSIARSYPDMTVHLLRLEEVFFDNDSIFGEHQSEDKLAACRSKLTELFSAVEGPSDKEDLIRFLRVQLLSLYAKKIGITKIVLGETSDRVATRAFANIVNARGVIVPGGAHYQEASSLGVQILRPLRDFLSCHVAMYLRIHNLQTVFRPGFDTGLVKDIGTFKLVENFLSNLQTNFPQTMPNVVRTCSRLRVPPSEGNSCGDIQRCQLCNGSLSRPSRLPPSDALDPSHNESATNDLISFCVPCQQMISNKEDMLPRCLMQQLPHDELRNELNKTSNCSQDADNVLDKIRENH